MTPDLLMSLSRVHDFLTKFSEMNKTPKELANWLLEFIAPLTDDTPIELFGALYSVRFVRTAALLALGGPVTKHKNDRGIIHRITLQQPCVALQQV